MRELGPDNVIAYLHDTGRLDPGVPAEARWLTWGVSNVVLRVHPAVGDDLVIKQSRRRLRTTAPWFSRLERVWREVDLMRTLAPLLPPGAIPRILFEDRENYLFAMEAVEADHTVWKAALLAGSVDPRIAGTLGDYLAAIHRGTAGDAALRERWIDRTIFDELRIDPFYRRVAEARPELRDPIQQMIEEMFATAVCVVHADFSPKNVLITGEKLVLVDFETGHFGDPAFDLGFFLSHVLLKTVLHASRCRELLGLARTFWSRYDSGLGERTHVPAFAAQELQRRTLAHLAGCMLARIDGTSPIDYLPEPDRQNFVRGFCRQLFLDPPDDLESAFVLLEEQLTSADWCRREGEG